VPVPAWNGALDEAAMALLGLALDEDCAHADVTAQAAVSPDLGCEAVLSSRQDAVIAGVPVLALMHRAFGTPLDIELLCKDGSRVSPAAVLARFHAPARAVLALERTILNFLQRMCGVATFTRAFVDAVAGTGVQIVDTRKTLPGWRLLDKYAVRCGGGTNHRVSLADMFMFKDNHLALTEKDMARLIGDARALKPDLPIACEAASLDDVRALCGLDVDILMLDNMTPTMVREAVALVQGRAVLEVTGGVTLATVREMAETGVARISVGALTHSAPAVDLTLDVRRAA